MRFTLFRTGYRVSAIHVGLNIVLERLVARTGHWTECLVGICGYVPKYNVIAVLRKMTPCLNGAMTTTYHPGPLGRAILLYPLACNV